MRMKGVHKNSRPDNWEHWNIDDQIYWLSKRRKRTANMEKELRFLTQKKKFEGFAKWLEEYRAKQKHTTAYQLKVQAKCRKKREVKKCEQCVRYESCIKGKPLYTSETSQGEIRLGQSIILSIEDSIKRCWQHGWKDQMIYWLKVLQEPRTSHLTASTIDGYASAQNIVKWCQKEYGEFQPIYEKTQKKYGKELKSLEKKLTKCKSGAKKEVLDQINICIRKLYGDTMV